MVEERFSSYEAQRSWDEKPLEAILLSSIAEAGSAPIRDAEYLAMFGLGDRKKIRAGEVWRHLRGLVADGPFTDPLAVILDEGTLARRILRAMGPGADRAAIQRVYSELCDCLERGRMFRAGS